MPLASHAMNFQISRNTPVPFVTAVAKDRLPVFRTEALKIVACHALHEARVSGGFLLFAYVIMPDHLHLFFGMRPNQSLSDLMRLVKGDSSEWINNEKLTAGKFRWQEGYGAFSYSKSHVDNVVKYILNQEEHHRKKTFLEEYKLMLQKFEVDYEEQYIFKELE